MTSLDAYKMQRLKTKIFSLLSQSLPKVKKKKQGCWNCAYYFLLPYSISVKKIEFD